jgi:hypothetical protein
MPGILAKIKGAVRAAGARRDAASPTSTAALDGDAGGTPLVLTKPAPFVVLLALALVLLYHITQALRLKEDHLLENLLVQGSLFLDLFCSNSNSAHNIRCETSIIFAAKPK